MKSGGLGPFLVRSVAGTGAVRIASMVASFGVGVLLARGLGVEGYGIYGIALSILTLIGIPAELGISKLVVREVAGAVARKDHPHLFGVLRWGDRVAATISLVAAAGVVAAALVLSAIGRSTLGLALLVGAPMIPMMALSRIREGALQGLHYVVRGQIPANLLRPVFLFALLAGAALLGSAVSPSAAIALYTVTAAAVLVVAQIWLRRRLPDTVPPKLVRNGRQWLASSIPMSITDAIRAVQFELAVLLLGVTIAPMVVGLFRISHVTAMMAAVPVQIVVSAGVSSMARLHAEEDHARLQRLLTTLTRLQVAGVVLLALPLLVAPEKLLSFAFGRSYVPAADALRVLSVGQIVNAAFGPNAAFLTMTHLEKRVTRAMFFALVVTSVSVPPLALIGGAEGAAFGLVGSLFCWNVLAWRDAWSIRGIDTSIIGRTRHRRL